MFLWAKLKAQFVIGPSPILALTCPDTPELGFPSSHSMPLENRNLLVQFLVEFLKFFV
jgi:hypothetical protein